MRQSSLIGHVIEILAEFKDNTSVPADALIRSFFYNRKYLGSKDRRFIADAYFSILKNYLRLEALVLDAFDDHNVFAARIVAAYCIAIIGMPPEEMQTVLLELHPREQYSKDAFWRMADRSREITRLSHLDPSDRLAIAYSFPKWFVERLSVEYGTDQVESMLNAMNDEAPTTLRANTLIVPNREGLSNELLSEGCDVTFSHLAQNALVLPKRVNVMGLNAFKRGAFEVQDEASQLVAPFANITKTAIRVLDACAGAGGKTLHLAALLKNRGELFATDIDPRKLEELKKRVRRSGAQNVRIIKPDQRETVLSDKRGTFDLMLLDVPCTGTGTLRRNPGIKWLLTEQMLEELTAKQLRILEENFEFLKPGGTLLYATCSILHEEGEDQIAAFTNRHPEFILEDTLRTRPDREGCDGFFVARLRRAS